MRSHSAGDHMAKRGRWITKMRVCSGGGACASWRALLTPMQGGENIYRIFESAQA